MSPVPSNTQEYTAYRAIREAILSGLLQPDAPLSVRALTEALQVGTMPTRAAVQRLIAERALEFSSNRKLRVPALAREEFCDLLAVTAELEAIVVRRIAGRVNPELLSELRQLVIVLKEQVESADKQKLLRLTREFWFKLYGAAGSPVLVQVLEGLWLRLTPLLVQAHAKQILGAQVRFDNAAHYNKFEGLVESLAKGSVDDALGALESLTSTLMTWFLQHYDFRSNSFEESPRR